MNLGTSEPRNSHFNLIDWGLIPYREAWDRQEALRAERGADSIPDTLIFCEHPPVFTTGRRDCRADWRATFDMIARAGIEIVETNRGGRITYHGPGQLVGYFIFDLHARKIGVHDFVCLVQRYLIRVLAAFGITAGCDTEHPGVWVGRDKIAALGLHISRGLTQHGFALNYAPRMSDYQYIVPCGIHDRGITSMTQLLGDTAPTRAALITTCTTIAEEMLGDKKLSS